MLRERDLSDRENEIHVEHFAVPLNGLFGVTATVGDVMDLFDFHETFLFCVGMSHEGCFCNHQG